VFALILALLFFCITIHKNSGQFGHFSGTPVFIRFIRSEDNALATIDCTHVPVLTYHSIHVDGSEYSTNDHIGLAHDLELIHRGGFRVIALDRLVQALTSGDWSGVPERSVVLTMDDGSWFDWYDLLHPSFGSQRSMANILRDFQQRHGPSAQPELEATSFVIGSPDARKFLDKSCLIGLGWWQDDWWRESHAEGLIKIANHSWDHRHGSLPDSLRLRNSIKQYGQFSDISTDKESDWQIRQTQEYLQSVLGTAPAAAFAYPYGDVPDFVADEYLPAHGESLGLALAMTTEAAPVTPASHRWRVPRYVFRRDWSRPEDLLRILEGQ